MQYQTMEVRVARDCKARVEKARVEKARDMNRNRIKLASVAALLCWTAAVIAQPVPELDFVTVGAAGNRGTLPSERPLTDDANRPLGAVPYEFRITRTEVRADQWWEFLEAFRPHMGDIAFDSRLMSQWIGREWDTGRFGRPSEQASFPVDVAWVYAARYCNWLHNDKRSDAAAFASGAYDITTFTFNADGTGNHQGTRSPGARFWIPSLDELFKSFYYDPDRYGAGEGGYWRYSNRSNEAFVIGFPEQGGTTNASLGWPHVESGRYPHVQTAFGLLDASGGMPELTDTRIGNEGGYRYAMGSSVFMSDDLIANTDANNASLFFAYVASGGAGFRVATVPNVGSLWILVMSSGYTLSRRRC